MKFNNTECDHAMENIEMIENVHVEEVEQRYSTSQPFQKSNPSKCRGIFSTCCSGEGGGEENSLTSHRNAPERIFSGIRSSSWRFVVQSVLLWVLICIPGNIFTGVLFSYKHNHQDNNGSDETIINFTTVDNRHLPAFTNDVHIDKSLNQK